MHTRLPALLALLFLAGCGFSPPGGPTASPGACSEADAPAADTVTAALGGLAPGTWQETSRGNTVNCRLYWVQASADPSASAPQAVLFFDRNTPLGTATPEPRPYTTVVATGQDNASVQYQWETATDAPGMPTGIGTVRFRLNDDGALTALDPIPAP